MKTTIKNQTDLSRVLVEIANLTPLLKDKAFDVEIKEHKEKRSKNANDYFHVLVHKIAEKLRIGNDECKVKMNLEYGTPLRIDEDTLFAFKVPKGAKVDAVVKYPKWVKETTENGKQFDVYMVYKETHTLNSGEMNRLISGTVDEAKELGIETLDEIELKQIIENYEKSIKE